MNEETKRRLEQDSPALATLCGRLLDAADSIRKEGFAAAENGSAFVSINILKRFEIEPVYEWVLVDTINALLREHPMISDLKAREDGYYIQFHPVLQQEAGAGHFEHEDENADMLEH